jgi:hypothetical protein
MRRVILISKPNRAHFYKQPNRKCQYATPEEEQQARQAAVEEQFKLWLGGGIG